MQTILIAIWEFIKKMAKKISLRTWIEIIVGLALLIAAITYIKKYNAAKEELNNAQNNGIAYQAQLEEANGKIVEFQFSMEQMRYFNDSISKKMTEAVDKIKVKDKKITQLQYLLSQYEKKDTIKVHDTIFREKDFVLDTTIGDKWVSNRLHLEYPSTIELNTKATSEKVLVFHTTKETVDPPKKFFICRWFQKKKTVVTVDIVENNPYLTSTQSRFVHVIE